MEAGYRAANRTERLKILDGVSFCRPDSEDFWCEGQGFGSWEAGFPALKHSAVHDVPREVTEGPYEGQYVPEQCRSANSTCIEAVMSNPSWSQGWGGLRITNQVKK